jgi:hypothetical protein
VEEEGNGHHAEGTKEKHNSYGRRREEGKEEEQEPHPHISLLFFHFQSGGCGGGRKTNRRGGEEGELRVDKRTGRPSTPDHNWGEWRTTQPKPKPSHPSIPSHSFIHSFILLSTFSSKTNKSSSSFLHLSL